jgi:hypothetical protein
MKRIALSLLMFTSSHVIADCQDDWLTYPSPTLYLSVIYSLGCYQGDLVINFLRPSKNGPRQPSQKSLPESILFDRECPSQKKNKFGEIIEFSCSSDGVTPLAGATYRFKQVKTTIRCDGIDEPDWDLSFRCISGCGRTTPKKLRVSHGEGCA